MARGKRHKLKSGTWITRELYTSPAFLELKGFAPQLLILFLGKRDMGTDHQVRNRDDITMTYIELQNFYKVRAGNLPFDFGKKGITLPRIARALDNLMAHGFIRIIHRGGAWQQDKTVYGLSDGWRHWRPGDVIHKREPDTRQRGWVGRKTNLANVNVTIHTNENVV